MNANKIDSLGPGRGTSQQSFLHGALIIMFGTFMAKFMGVFFRLVLGNIIGAEGNGYYSTAYSIYKPLYAISISGFPVALAKLVAEDTARGFHARARRTFKVARRTFVVFGIVLMLLMLVFSRQMSDFMHNSGARFAIVALAPVALFCCISSAYKGFYEGLRNMYPTAVSEIIEAICKLVFGVIFMNLGSKLGAATFLKTGTLFGLSVRSESEARFMLGAAGAVCGIAISALVGMLFLFLCHGWYKEGTKALSGAQVTESDLKLLKNILKIAIPICLSSIVFNISGNIDARTAKIGLDHAVVADPEYFARLLANVGRTVQDIPNFIWGDYGLTLPIYNFLPAIMVSFGVSLLPNLAASWSTKNRVEAQRQVESSLRITNILAFLAGSVVISNARNILMLVYAKRAADVEVVVPTLRILGACLIVSSIASSVNIVLQAIGRVRIPLVLMTGGVIIKYGTNKFLIRIPSINIKGAAIGTLFCYLFISIVGLVLFFKISRLSIDTESVFKRPSLAGVSVLVIGFFVEWLGVKITTNSTLSTSLKSLVLLGVMGIVALVMLCVFKVIKEEDVLMLPKGEQLSEMLKRYKVI